MVTIAQTVQHEQHRALMEQLAAGRIPDLPLGRHVVAAYHEFESVVPKIPEWQSGVFHFVRVLRSSPDLEKLSAKKALQEVERVLAAWAAANAEKGGARALADAAWRRWFSLEPERARVDFIDGWGKVRCPAGRRPFHEAWHRAQTEPIEFGPDQLSIDSSTYRRLLGFAAWLQVTNGQEPIFLPIKHVGPLLDVSPTMVSKYIRFAVTDGFVRVVEKHTAKKAARIVFDVRRIPPLKAKAHPSILAWIEEHFNASG